MSTSANVKRATASLAYSVKLEENNVIEELGFIYFTR